jgi:hypothetical protein
MSESQWVQVGHSVLWTSQQELTCWLPFSSCFLYNVKIGKLIALLATCFHTGFLLGLFHDPEDGATYSYETLTEFQCSIQRYIPEVRILHNHHCENLRSVRHVLEKGKSLQELRCNNFYCIEEDVVYTLDGIL